MSSRTSRWLIGGSAACLLLTCACCGFPVFPEALFYLTFGWALFLFHVLPGVQMNVGNTILATVLLAVFVVGLHAALGWLYRARRNYLAADQPSDQIASATLANWQWKWTTSIVSVTVLAFVAGISTVGVTHQLAWLVTSEVRLVETGMREAGWRVMSKNNLSNISKALHNYASGLGSFPPGTMTTPEGRMLHGWQTYLLPYLEAGSVERLLHRDKPWNDPANREGFSMSVSTRMAVMASATAQPPPTATRRRSIRPILDFSAARSPSSLLTSPMANRTRSWLAKSLASCLPGGILRTGATRARDFRASPISSALPGRMASTC